jgi:tripartite-type tricarboxylate transporter receptor subunit TctC
MRAKLANEGAEPVLMSPQEFSRFVQSEIEKFRKIIRSRNIKQPQHQARLMRSRMSAR